jgi:hypothetical protein
MITRKKLVVEVAKQRRRRRKRVPTRTTTTTRNSSILLPLYYTNSSSKTCESSKGKMNDVHHHAILDVIGVLTKKQESFCRKSESRGKPILLCPFYLDRLLSKEELPKWKNSKTVLL